MFHSYGFCSTTIRGRFIKNVWPPTADIKGFISWTCGDKLTEGPPCFRVGNVQLGKPPLRDGCCR